MKAKELRPYAEKLITLAKREEGILHARRLVARDIQSPRVREEALRHPGGALRHPCRWLHAHPAPGPPQGRRRGDGHRGAARLGVPAEEGRGEGQEGSRQGRQRPKRPNPRRSRLPRPRAARRPRRERPQPSSALPAVVVRRRALGPASSCLRGRRNTTCLWSLAPGVRSEHALAGQGGGSCATSGHWPVSGWACWRSHLPSAPRTKERHTSREAPSTRRTAPYATVPRLSVTAPLRQLPAGRPPTSALLAKKNAGTFPKERVAKHGGRSQPGQGAWRADMPVWGDAFKQAKDGLSEAQVKDEDRGGRRVPRIAAAALSLLA